VEIKTALAVTGPNPVQALYALSGDAKFNVKINGQAPGTDVTVPKSTTDHTTIDGLVADVNRALGAGSKILAGHIGDRLTFTAKDPLTVTKFEISASSDNPAVTDLGLATSLASVRALKLAGTAAPGAPAPARPFTLSRDATFKVTINGATTPVEVNVVARGTEQNAALDDLVADVNSALGAAGIGDRIQAASDGDKLILRSITPAVTSFAITATATNPAVSELHLPASGSGVDEVALTARKKVLVTRGRLTRGRHVQRRHRRDDADRHDQEVRHGGQPDDRRPRL
jgi:hypothetical protein